MMPRFTSALELVDDIVSSDKDCPLPLHASQASLSWSAGSAPLRRPDQERILPGISRHGTGTLGIVSHEPQVAAEGAKHPVHQE